MTKIPDPDPSRVLRALNDVRNRLDAGLESYVTELLKWNPQLGLVSKRDPERTITKLVQQSVALWDFVIDQGGDMSARVVDIGTGGGFPGMVWKLLQPHLDITLVERKARKAAFLERVLYRLGAPRGVTVLADDVAVVAGHRRPAFGLAVMMAVAPDSGILAALDALLLPSGTVVTVRPAGRPGGDALFAPRFEPAATLQVEDATFLLLRRSV